MNEGIEELDELHAAGQQALKAICEIVEQARSIARRFELGKRATKVMRMSIIQRIDDWQAALANYRQITSEDRIIKVWWLLLDTLIEVHQAEVPPQDCPLWRLLENRNLSHCHDMLGDVSIIAALYKVTQETDSDLVDFARLSAQASLLIVAGEEFAHFFESEFEIARQFLEQRYDEAYPISAALRLRARRECLLRITEHGRGCLDLVRNFVKINSLNWHWSKSRFVETRQAESRWDRIENQVSRIADASRDFREVPESLEMLGWIRKANVEHLREIVIQGKSFATAHEAIESLELLVDNAIDECDGFSERDNVDELSEILRRIEIPDLDGLLLIEQERTNKWLEIQYEDERSREKDNEVIAENAGPIQELDHEIESPAGTTSLADHLQRVVELEIRKFQTRFDAPQSDNEPDSQPDSQTEIEQPEGTNRETLTPKVAWHLASEPPPLEFYQTPLSGTKMSLAQWIMPGSQAKRADRTLDRKLLNDPGLWGRKIMERAYEVYFNSETRYREAVRIRDNGETSPD